MLNSISWEHFLTTAIVVVGGYYFIAVLLLFGDEIKSFLYQKKTNQTSDRRDESQSLPKAAKSFIGKARFTPTSNVQKEEDLDAQFAVAEVASVTDEEPIDIVTQASILVKAAEELCAEVLSLIEELKPTTIEETELVMRPLLKRYAFLFQSEHRQVIYEFIIKKLYASSRLRLSQHDVENLWTSDAQ